MYFIFWSLALIEFVGVTSSTQNNSLGARIIGGQVAYAGQFPFLAAITKHRNDGIYFCGGSILNREWLITSGQCVYGAILFEIQLGSNFLDDSNALKLATDAYIIHPKFNAMTLSNDIGLIKFRIPITYTDYMKPINLLPATHLSNGSPLVIMGWGQLSDENGDLPKNLYFVSVTTIPNNQCKAIYGNQIQDHMACAEGNYNEGTCYGDIGGPLIQYASRGQVMHVAVASFISQNGCESTDPSGYTRTFNYVNWIKNITGFY